MMQEEIAYFFHFSLSDLKKMTVLELVRWHDAVIRMNKQVNAG